MAAVAYLAARRAARDRARRRSRSTRRSAAAPITSISTASAPTPPTRSTAPGSASSRSRRSPPAGEGDDPGRGAHPGSAKGKLVNAVKLAADFVAVAAARRALAGDDRGARGLRPPVADRRPPSRRRVVADRARPRRREARASTPTLRATACAEEIEERSRGARVEVEVRSSTATCGRVIDGTPRSSRRRGGDPPRRRRAGALDHPRRHRRRPPHARGLPTPNLFTGGQNYHSLREWASVQDMAAAAATVVELVRVGRAGLRVASRAAAAACPVRVGPTATRSGAVRDGSVAMRRRSRAIVAEAAHLRDRAGSSAAPLSVSSYSTRGGDSA